MKGLTFLFLKCENICLSNVVGIVENIVRYEEADTALIPKSLIEVEYY